MQITSEVLLYKVDPSKTENVPARKSKIEVDPAG